MTLILSGTDGLSDVDGSAATPAIRGTDANTGIFFPAADQVAITTGGTQRAVVDASGYVGIGTSSPNRPLHLVSSGTTTPMRIDSGGSSESLIDFKDTATTADFKVRVGSSGDNFVAFAGGSERMRIDSSGNLGIGVTPSATWSSTLVKALQIGNNAASVSSYTTSNTSGKYVFLTANAAYDGVSGSGWKYIDSSTASQYALLGNEHNWNIAASGTAGNAITWTQAMTLNSSGSLLVGKTSDTFSAVGGRISPTGVMTLTADSNELANFNRLTNDGVLLYFSQANTIEGNISVSGTTVSYNGGHLSRYAQTQGAKDESLVKGTVLSNLDEMNVYVAPTTYWTEEDELPEGVSVGNVKVETHSVNNEQLNKVKVSDVEGDANVAGVFVNWSHDEDHNVDEINMAMTGDMIIRIAQGVTVARGDLLMSAGDGTAKPQGDDIVRSKTVAKVTSTHVTCTYADGSFCVPCVLMAC
jgi:hypothetical protein